ncbi:Adaptive-response sensory-kinase SasA [Lysinibacillus sphaericus]
MLDLIIDATDNFETRFLLNDFAVKYEIPWIYGACVGSYGITYTILPHETPCLHCLMEIIPLSGGTTCDTVGIIAPTVTQVVSHQMVEALKILVEDWEAIRKELLAFDLWKNEQTKINVKSLKKSTCLTCGLNPTYPYLTKESITKVAVLCGRNTVQIRPAKPKLVNIIEFEKNLAPHVQHLKSNPFLIHFQVNQNQIILFRDGRVLIHGTNDIVDSRDVEAVFDPKWTVEALYNIVDNAIKYTPSGGSVQLSVTPYQLFCRIDVADTGLGISEDETAKIFSRFYRSQEVTDKEGVGLGLYLAREIITAQGGYIKVKSRLGVGSVFSVFLPIKN